MTARLSRTLGIVVLLVTAVVTVSGARIARSQWLLFTADSPGSRPTGVGERVSRAAALAPDAGPLSLWTAQQAHQQFLSAWLASSAPANAEAAMGTAALAVRAHPGNPYAHIHLGQVALDRARHPRTDPAHHEPLRSRAVAHLTTALGLYPSSPDVGHRVATALLAAWPALDDSARRIALQGIRQVGALDRLRFPQLLATLAEALIDAGDSAGELIETIRRATPEGPTSLVSAARLLQDLAGSRVDSTGWSHRLLSASMQALADAARESQFHVDWVRRWLRAAARSLPDDIVELVETAQVATVDYPDAPGAWLALGWATQASGDLAAATRATHRARDLARDDLLRLLEQPARPNPGGAIHDEALLLLARARMQSLRAADRGTAGETRAAIDRNRKALGRAVELLGELETQRPGENDHQH